MPYSGPSLFHLGYIKTATTYLQRRVFVPGFGFAPGAGEASRSRLIGWFVTGDDYLFDAAGVAKAIAASEAAARERAEVPVWSDETLLGNPITRTYNGHPVLARIAALPIGKKVLITVREQRSFALSAYREYIAQGGANPLRDFIGTGQEPESFTPILRPEFLMYDRVVAHCQTLFGAENLLVLPYELLRRDPPAYLARLRDFLRLQGPAGELPGEAVHAGMGGSGLVLRRMLNRAVVRSPLTPRPTLGQRAVARAARLADRLAPDGLDRRIEDRWRGMIGARYEGMFGGSNRRLEQLTGLDLKALGYQ